MIFAHKKWVLLFDPRGPEGNVYEHRKIPVQKKQPVAETAFIQAQVLTNRLPNRDFPFASSEATILPNPRLISKPNCDFDENACL